VSQWVHRVKRLSELGLEEEASELEQSLIELTRNDPELQQEFLKALTKDAGRLAQIRGRTKRSEHRGQIESPAKGPGRHPGTTAQTTPSAQPTAQILQPHSHTQQSHRLTAAIERLGQHQLITAQIPPCPGLLQCGLGKVMKLHFDERLARADSCCRFAPCGFSGFPAVRQLIQATPQIRQIDIVGIFHTDRLSATVVMHQAFINPTGQTPESLTKTAEFAHQRQLFPLAQLQTIDIPSLAKLVRSDLAHPVQLAHRQAADKVFDLIRRDHKQALGFFQSLAILARNLFGATPAKR
jgi:hypothetical protein